MSEMSTKSKSRAAEFASIRRPWRSKVRQAAKEDGDSFHFCAPATGVSESSRPLLVIVHPGDAIEDGVGYSEGKESQDVIEFGRTNAIGMADEIELMMKTHDVVILHRQSSLDTFMRPDFGRYSSVEKAVSPYTAACLKASDVGSVLYGDDLASAAEWMLQNLNASERPSIYMTGAYACAKYGCITAMGRALQEGGCTQIQVSAFAPTDNSNWSPRWNPSDTLKKKIEIKP